MPDQAWYPFGEMAAYMYPISLAVMSGFVMLLERLFPWRPEQKQLRPKLWSDFIHLVFNGHFLGLLLAGLASTWILPSVDRWLAAEGLTDSVYRNAAAEDDVVREISAGVHHGHTGLLG